MHYLIREWIVLLFIRFLPAFATAFELNSPDDYEELL
jgi:hypothetical protein